MSQIANISIADGKATPTTHVFGPVTSAPEAMYRESLVGLPLIGQGVLSSLLKSQANAPIQRVRVKLSLPALETATGQNASGYTAAPKVAYSNDVIVDFLLPSRGTPDQRKDLRVMLSNLLKDAQIIDLIDNLSPQY